jgi:hypothetical protein
MHVGDSITLTVTVRAPEVGPIDIDEPQFTGFDVVERRDRSQVSVGTGVRTSRRDLVLRATETGDFSMGPFRVRVAGTPRLTNTVRVTVAPAAQPAEALSPRVRALVARAAPVGSDSGQRVEVSVLRSSDSVRLGEQIDLVVTAWFPRELRARLRAPPSLLPPDIRGAWGYSQPTPAALVATREIEGRAYDLFVRHEIVFALTPGDLEVGPAKVTYSLPISGSFLSREIRHEEQSVPFLIRVAPNAETGIDRVVVGRDLVMDLTMSTTVLALGDAAHLAISLTGSGNVALWPEPQLEWPAGLQAYQERSSVTVSATDGILGGTKRFEYLVVADSSGMHRLPAPTYEYFDLDRDTFVTVTASPVVIETPETARRAAPLRAAPPLLADTWILQVPGALRRIAPWVWILIFAVPPLLAGATRARRARTAKGETRVTAQPSALARLEDEMRGVLGQLVPGADGGSERRLTDALVAAGVEPMLASHASRVRERLRQARYGPEVQSDTGELSAEVAAVVSGLQGHRRGNAKASVAAALGLVFATLTVPVHAQSIERLWDAGAAGTVADSLSARLRANPYDAVQAFNLSLAWEQLGETARARAAWLKAARLAPYHPRIQRAGARWARQSAPGLWIAPLGPWESLALAALCWIVGWGMLALRQRRWIGRLALLASVAVGGFSGITALRYRVPYGLILTDATPVRTAPYGPAEHLGTLQAADAVRVSRVYQDWRLVTADGLQGWVHVSEVLEP